MRTTRRFGLGMVAGAAFTAVALTATTAYAGSGVGGVFNLGQSNTVNATTTLTGSTAGPMLQVTNTNTGTGTTGLSITVPASMPPLKVSSSRVAPNLNSDLVDGYSANGLARVSQNRSASVTAAIATPTILTATINVPKTGFVIARGQALLTDSFSAAYCGSCYFKSYVFDDTANAASDMTAERIGIGASGDETTITNQFVFPVTAGTRTFSLRIGQLAAAGGPGNIYNPVLVLQFVPFDGTGAPTTTSTASASSTDSGGTVSDSGSVRR